MTTNPHSILSYDLRLQDQVACRLETAVEEVESLASTDMLFDLPYPGMADAAVVHGLDLSQIEFSAWCNSATKRGFDLCVSSVALIMLTPLLLAIGLAVRITSPGPVIFRQRRVGKHGVEFTIYKFRTMMHYASGPRRSSHRDPRLTPPGRFLRKYKLDELPQLLNVCLGNMSLIGPRPKLHGHHCPDTHSKPGISGAATLAFAAEEHLLRNVPHHLLEECHAQIINPRKLALDLNYMARATFLSDLHLIFRTLLRAGRYQDLDEVEAYAVMASAKQAKIARSQKPVRTH